MKKTDDWRLVLGLLSVLVLGLLNVSSNGLVSLIAILSVIVMLVSAIIALISFQRPKLKVIINSWLYQVEFFAVLIIGMCGGRIFTGWEIWGLILAVILYIATWLLDMRSKMAPKQKNKHK